MNSRERFLTALRHGRPDRAPFNIWMDRRLMADFAREYDDPHFRVRQWGADVVESFSGLAFPHGPQIEQTGTHWQLEPLLHRWEDAGSLDLPDPDADNVYSLLVGDLEQFPEHAVVLDLPTCWGVACGIRTFELIMTDMLDHPEQLRDLCARVTDIQARVVERACQMGITALYLMEDVTSAGGPMMSRDCLHTFCLDFARQLADIARSQGVPVMFHCCGKAMDVLEDIETVGIDAINPLQPHLNDLDDFHQRFGARLALYGGLDNCFIIPTGGVDQVRAHVLDVFERVGRDGGLIFSTHDIPIDTPRENIFAVIDTIREECRY